MINAAAKVTVILPNQAECLGDRDTQFRSILWTAVGKHALGELPDALVGIEFWGVAWEAQQVEARHTSDEFLDEPTAVGSPAIPEQEHVAAQVMQEVA